MKYRIKKAIRKLISLALLTAFCSLVNRYGLTDTPLTGSAVGTVTTEQMEQTSLLDSSAMETVQIPDYSGTPYVAVNGNIPFFSADDLTTESFEYYSALDALGRCGITVACIGRDIMPTAERESIVEITPSGWDQAYYDFVDQDYLYNRCHLLGFQLTGENANECNLITGTRYLNVEGMLPFENMIAEYIYETDHHVLLRVTPLMDGTNLVADGVLMEAMSVEDNGAGICFNVYCYNVQPGVIIDYATGESRLAQ